MTNVDQFVKHEKSQPRLRQFQQQIVGLAKRNVLFGTVFHALSWRRSRPIASLLEPWLPSHGDVLDVGTGTGHVAALVQGSSRRLVACDMLDLLTVPLTFVLADGKCLPFADGSFDVVLLVTVLHHVAKANHKCFLAEATRVLRPNGRLVLLEDTYHTAFELGATKIFDSIMNGEFAGHPHSNRTLADWTQMMMDASLHVMEQSEHVSWYGLFRIRHGMVIGARR